MLDSLPDAKGVQLDLYLKDDERVYTVEVQVKKKVDFPRRLRYYQSTIDSEVLPKGTSYADLRDSYIIFLCAHDPFGDGIPVYTMERTCLENCKIIDMGAHWLAFNCHAWARAEGEGLRNLLEYLESGRVAKDDELLSAMDAAVAQANDDRKWVNKVRGVMTLYDDARTEGLMDGRAEGRAVGIAEGEERLSSLIGALLSENRIDDIKRATTDVSYREGLFREFNIA